MDFGILSVVFPSQITLILLGACRAHSVYPTHLHLREGHPSGSETEAKAKSYGAYLVANNSIESRRQSKIVDFLILVNATNCYRQLY